jgi:FkbH-like protein
MLLQENHISVFQANWLDKPSNLEAIAKALNIGLDALVFLDDNPAERAQVRAALPMVAVPELPQDPSLYVRTLLAAGYFEATTFSKEDLLRSESYASDAQRAEVLTKSRDLGDYLKALEMEMSISGFDSIGRQRIAQLINKSNQFNLTTRRYTEAEIAAMEADPTVYTAQVRLKDKFGDLGMIAVVICRTATDVSNTWDIDTWLMSCRVLGRKIEDAMLGEILADARRAGVTTIRGFYIPTEKNSMVSDHYTKLGFKLVETTPEGRRAYRLAVAEMETAEVPMRIVRRVTEKALV